MRASQVLTRLAPVVLAVVLAVLLAGCDVIGRSPAQTLPTVVLDTPGPAKGTQAARPPEGSGPVASGIVVPGRQLQMAAALAGSVLEVPVKEGDRVTQGQVLVRFSGRERLVAAVAAASAELLAAQQSVKALNDNQPLALAAARLRLARANKALEDAAERRQWRDVRGASQSQVETAQADVVLARDLLKKAEDRYQSFAGKPSDDLNRAAALSALSAARLTYERAVANLNYLLSLPNPHDVDLAEAELQAARAEVESAQAQVERLKSGPDPDALALAQERVKTASAQLAAGQAALAELELKAPFAGTLARLYVLGGEWAVPGQPLLVLADLQRLRVETTDLSERDVPQVKAGQAVSVNIKALNQQAAGRVSQVAALAETLGGDVVYRATVDLDAIPEGLRPGMSVEVRFR